eukprot:SAG31_NODE_7228_length_1749_cov_1.541212_2_plen_142_part_00
MLYQTDGTAEIIRRDTSPFSVIENGSQEVGPSLSRVGSRMSRTSTAGTSTSQDGGTELTRILSTNTSSVGRVQRLIDACAPLAVNHEVAEYALNAFRHVDGREDYDCAESWIRDPDNAEAIAKIAAGEQVLALTVHFRSQD